MPIIKLSPTFFDRFAIVDEEEEGEEFIGWGAAGPSGSAEDEKDHERTGAMTFPLAAIPAGATIVSCKLKIFYTSNNINTGTILLGPGSGNIIDFNSYSDSAIGAQNFVDDTQQGREEIIFTYNIYKTLVDDNLTGLHEYDFDAIGISDLQAAVDSAQINFSIASFAFSAGGGVIWKDSTHPDVADRPVLEVGFTDKNNTQVSLDVASAGLVIEQISDQ